MKGIFSILVIFIMVACTKQETTTVAPVNTTPSTPAPVVSTPTEKVYLISILDSISAINKTTSWYTTNKSFDQIFDVFGSYYWGFESIGSSLIPYNTGTTATWSSSKSYYWNDLGTYLYTDLTGDGKKDLWAYYWKNPWPTNAIGLHLFSEYEKDKYEADIQFGLTQVRKCVVTDFNNDKQKEVMLFSSGYDGHPFPGDSLGIFWVKEKRYQYLNKDIGYFHGGATGDINKDGFVDIVAYSGGSAIIPIHPTCYINNGKGDFTLSKEVFKNFNQDGSDNYYTVELFDIDSSSFLHLIQSLKGKHDVPRILS